MKFLPFVSGFIISIAWASTSSRSQNDIHIPWFHDASNYWDFDEDVNNTILDLKGNLRSQIIGNYSFIPGPKDNAVEFHDISTKSTPHVVLGDFGDTCLPNPQTCNVGFTISFWVNLRKVFNDGVLLQLSSSRQRRGITVNTSYKEGRIFLVFYSNTPSQIYSIEAELNSHIWHHVALIWNTTSEKKMTLFVNCSSNNFETKITKSKSLRGESRVMILGANHARKKATPIAVDDFAIWYKPLNQIRLCQIVNQERVHGNYSNWSKFSRCSATCNNGTRTRTRMCDNPVPDYGGRNCSKFGPSFETIACNTKSCPIQGGYTQWSDFTPCSTSCGNGSRFRTRSCTNPKPQYGGQNCTALGRPVESEKCNNTPCPIHGNYSHWSAFSFCSASCGDGYKTRNRTCTNPTPKYGGQNCTSLGLNYDIKTCFLRNCPVHGNFSEWSEFSKCSTTCGNGVKKRYRNCTQPVPMHGGNDCSFLGPSVQILPCEVLRCPIDGNYSEWSTFSPCSKTCDNGTQVRRRFCKNPAPRFGGRNCSWLGPRVETRQCATQVCLAPNALPPLKTVGRNTSSTSLSFSWQAIPRTDIKGILRGYAVFYKPHFSNEATQNVTVSLGNLSVHLTDLKKFTEYELQVAGVTSYGMGEMSTKALVYTDEDVPDAAPVFRSFGNESSTSIKLQWRKVPSNRSNGVIVGYHVFYRPYFNNGSWAMTTVPDNETQLVVKNLKVYSKYWFRTSAFTRKGDGISSNAILVWTDEDVPCSAPTEISAGSTNSTTAWLKWHRLALPCHQGVLVGYTVFFKRKSASLYQNITVPSMNSEAVLYNLRKFTVYHFAIAAFTSKGIGPVSETVVLRTEEDVPSTWPRNIHAVNTSSTSIQITWDPIPLARTHGILLGYRIHLRRANESEWADIFNVTASDLMTTRERLWKYTKYVLRVTGFTSVGAGPLSPDLFVWTDEDVPSLAPEQFMAINKSSPASIPLTWKPIGDPFYVHGILLGYMIEYQMTHLAGQRLNNVGSNTVLHITGPNTLSFLLTGLEIYAVYRIKLRAFTVKGNGVTAQISAETCKCASAYRTNWWINPPYTDQKDDTNISGIFPEILPRMVATCCGFCHAHARTITRFVDTSGDTYRKSGVSEFRSHVADTTELHFPMYGQVYQVKYYKQYEFIPLVESAGVIFLVREDDTHLASVLLLETVTDTLPIVIVMLASTLVVGIIIWGVESFSNQDHFPPSFFTGVYHGLWWALVSMTTIGYGDKFPRSIVGRIIGIIWILAGSIFISLYTSVVTSHITREIVEDQLKLYGTKVAVIQNSSEHQLAVRKNAHADSEHSYDNLQDIYNALNRGYVKGALVDAYVLGSNTDLFDEATVRIHKIYDYSSAYGLVLAGEAKKLQKCFREYVSENRRDIFKIIDENVHRIKKSEVSRSVKRAKSLIDPTFTPYKKCLFISFALFLLALVCGFLFDYVKKRSKRAICCLNYSWTDASRRKAELSKTQQFLQREMNESLLELTNKLQKLKSQHLREWQRWIKLKKPLWRERRKSDESLMRYASVIRYHESYHSPLLQLRKLISPNNSSKRSSGSTAVRESQEETVV